MMMRILAVLTLLTLGTPVAEAQTQGESLEDRDARMAWWRDAKFGMFVHWGVYSVTGGTYQGKELPNSAEWMMNRGRIPIAEYETYAARFNPTAFDADEFVGRAKRAGMKYLIITAKHHDGFSMFDSKCSPYNVVDATPFGRDIMKELADACQEQGIRFGFYYSQAQDWHHPGGMGNHWDKTIHRVSTDQYVMQKAFPEVEQLLTDYGPIGMFWWDTPRKMSRSSFDALHSLTKLQPGVITNDRLGEDYPGDHKTFERKIPKQAPGDKDWEVCMPISGSWGYKQSDKAFKSVETLIHNLIDIASKGGNYLLNVSPTGEGTLLPPAIERLEAIGAWIRVNGDAIYGTKASPLGDLSWGRCTRKETAEGTTLYLHVFDWPSDGRLVIPNLTNTVRQAKLLDGGQTLPTSSSDAGLVISTPGQAPDPIASVIVLQVEGKLRVEANLPMVGDDGSLVLAAVQAYIHNNEGSPSTQLQTDGDGQLIGNWIDPESFVEWTFRTSSPGAYKVSALLSVESEATGLACGLPGNLIPFVIPSTGSSTSFVKRSLGEIHVAEPGEVTLRIKPDSKQWNPINLRQVEIRLQ